MFQRVLIANRGEIALRICRTLREMGLQSVAVFSDADRHAPHVAAADASVHIGGAAASDSYLDVQRVLAAARTTGSDAIIPGYGFLSENAGFVRACHSEGITFIGPNAEAVESMGQKQRAREAMANAGVPVLPGGPAQTEQQALQTANEVGFPVLLKAASGGGGKGMRLLRDESELKRAFESAKREAKRSFDDDTLYVEKAVTSPRHIEVQVLGDLHGNVVHLFERDCSIQRRHQKIVEETPAVGLDAATASLLYEAALNAARSMGYSSAGTVEFLMDDSGNFYFLEMNTRLQVEHPITEAVTGIDLVREMVNIARGKPLRFAQEQIVRRGHAIECRVYAEAPQHGFLPRTGTIEALQEPAGPFVRVDSALYDGAQITAHYDPLLSKVCCWGEQRSHAIECMARALHEYRLEGIETNLGLLARIMADPDFARGACTTSYLDTHLALLSAPAPSPAQLAAMAAVAFQSRALLAPQFSRGEISSWARATHPAWRRH